MALVPKMPKKAEPSKPDEKPSNLPNWRTVPVEQLRQERAEEQRRKKAKKEIHDILFPGQRRLP